MTKSTTFVKFTDPVMDSCGKEKEEAKHGPA
jgi:hypothetical protein